MPAIASLLPGITPPVQPLAPPTAGEGLPDFADLFGNAAAGGGKGLPGADGPAKAGKHPVREVLPGRPDTHGEAEASAFAAEAHGDDPSSSGDAGSGSDEVAAAAAPIVFTPILGMTWIVPKDPSPAPVKADDAPGVAPSLPIAVPEPLGTTLTPAPADVPAASARAAVAQANHVPPLAAVNGPDASAFVVPPAFASSNPIAPLNATGPSQVAPAVLPAVAPPLPTASTLPTASERPGTPAGHRDRSAADQLLAPPPPPSDTAALLGARPAAASRTAIAATALVQSAERIETPGAGPVVPTIAAPTHADAPQPPLDVTRHTWPAQMIDRIEHLRDAVDAVSTSIRVVPDALGAIDVSVRKEGEVTHVHLAADQPQTRALLAEAQPKLTELAEQRGLRLGQAEVGGSSASTAGDQQQTPQHQAARQPAAPVRTTRGDTITPDDARIA